MLITVSLFYQAGCNISKYIPACMANICTSLAACSAPHCVLLVVGLNQLWVRQSVKDKMANYVWFSKSLASGVIMMRNSSCLNKQGSNEFLRINSRSASTTPQTFLYLEKPCYPGPERSPRKLISRVTFWSAIQYFLPLLRRSVTLEVK